MALAQRNAHSRAATSLRSSTSVAIPVHCAARIGRSIQLAPSTTSSSGHASVVARAASTREQEAQARWTQQVKDGTVMNVSNKAAGELKAFMCEVIAAK